MLNGLPTFQHLHFRFTPCYMDSLHFNIYSSDSRNATWRDHISTFSLQISAILQEQPTFQHLLCRYPPCYMDIEQCNIYFADSRHATWTANISIFTLLIPAMLHGPPTYQHLLLRCPPCCMDTQHFNIYTSDSRHATWTAYHSTFTLHINAMLHVQPTFQHLLFTLPPQSGKVSTSFLWFFITSGSSNILNTKSHMIEGHRPHITILLIAWRKQHLPCPALPCTALPWPALPLHFNIFSADYHHATWTAHNSTFTQHFPAMIHGQHTFEHLLFRITPCYMNSLNSNIYSPHYCKLHEQPTFKHLLCI